MAAGPPLPLHRLGSESQGDRILLPAGLFQSGQCTALAQCRAGSSGSVPFASGALLGGPARSLGPGPALGVAVHPPDVGGEIEGWLLEGGQELSLARSWVASHLVRNGFSCPRDRRGSEGRAGTRPGRVASVPCSLLPQHACGHTGLWCPHEWVEPGWQNLVLRPHVPGPAPGRAPPCPQAGAQVSWPSASWLACRHPLAPGLPAGAACLCPRRAAAYSKLGNYAGAVQDCERAICIDPAYSKAYGRMG